LSRGVDRVLHVRHNMREPQEDLTHTLLRWQQSGIAIESMMLDEPATPPMPITVQKPPLFRIAWQRMLAVAGLRRNPLGGFGGVLPEPGSGG
jgi:hypothetical protein